MKDTSNINSQYIKSNQRRIIMKATITLHKKPSIVERAVNYIFFGCKTEYIMPEPAPKPDPMEGMTDEQKIEYLKRENAALKKKLIKATRKENEYKAHLFVNKVNTTTSK